VSDTLLQTKLYMPRLQPSLVSRPHLIDKLNQGLQQSRKLTLVSAPAGFGKTTLVTAWGTGIMEPGAIPSSANLNPQLCWLSLDEGDNDLTRFLTYFVAALQTIDCNFGQGILAALQHSGMVNTEVVLTNLINEIAVFPDDVVLILDDYHVIDSPPIDQALTFILDHLPPQMHLIVASRIDPSWPLSRLRANGQMTEIRVNDLRFSPDEAAAFLNQVMRFDLSAQDVAALGARTEGWIAGLQLAALSVQGSDDVQAFVRSFTGSNRYILDYLGEEVLQQRPQGTRDFLLHTSVLDRLSAPLCDAVTDRNDSQAILESLEQANLFIVPLDDDRRWYRYHHLFTDLLRYRLLLKETSIIPTLHRRASKWYEQNGFIATAIEHTIAADDVDRATRLIEEHYRPALRRGEVSAVLGWLESIPDDRVHSDPSLSVGYAWALFLSGQMDAIEARLRDAETILAERGTSGNNAQAAELWGEIATLRSFLFRVQGEPVRGIELAQQVLEQVPKDNLAARGVLHTVLGGLFRDTGDMAQASQAYAEAIPICQAAGNIMAAMMAAELLVQLLMIQGQLQRAAEVCQQMQIDAGRPEARSHQRKLAPDLVCMSMGDVLYEWNELDDAEAYVRQGIEQGKRGGFFQAVVYGQILLARVLQARGDMSGATNMLQEAVRSARMNPPEWYRIELVACQVQLWLAQGNLVAASRWAQESDLSVEAEFNPGNEFEHIALAQVLIAQGRADSDRKTLNKALGLLERLSLAAESAGRVGNLIELLILQALTLEAQEELDRALACLDRALALAEPQGYVRIFVDKGNPMAEILREAAARGIMPAYTGKLLTAFEADERRVTTPPQSLIEPLSPRELEVLQLIAQGLSNREIGERLFLALSTVKGHNRNIYGKLQVQRRTEAVARARELGLV